MEGYSYKVLSKYRVVQDTRTDDHHVPCEWKWKRGGAAETLSALHPFLLCHLCSTWVFQVIVKGGDSFNTVQYMALLLPLNFLPFAPPPQFR